MTEIQTLRGDAVQKKEFALMLTAIVLWSMGAMILLFGASYIRDLETLRTVPNAIWDAICGRPNPDSIALPLLLSLGTVAVLSGVAVYGYKALFVHTEGDA